MEAAKAKAPDFAWPALQLANIYSTGKFTDGKKSGAHLSSFFSVCSSSTDNRAQWILGKGGDTALQARVAAALRERLAKEYYGYDLLHFARDRFYPGQPEQ